MNNNQYNSGEIDINNQFDNGINNSNNQCSTSVNNQSYQYNNTTNQSVNGVNSSQNNAYYYGFDNQNNNFNPNSYSQNNNYKPPKNKFSISGKSIFIFILSLICLWLGGILIIGAFIIFIYSLLRVKDKDVMYYFSLLTSFWSVLAFILSIVSYISLVSTHNQTHFVGDARDAVNDVRSYVLRNRETKKNCFTLNDINNLSGGFLDKSSFDKEYSKDSYVYVNYSTQIPSYYICLVDVGGNGINYVNANDLSKDLVVKKKASCVLPASCK